MTSTTLSALEDSGRASEEPTSEVAPRIESLFHEVAELAPDDARRVLDARCAGAPSLRAAVQDLLDHDRALSGSFLRPDAALCAEALEAARERIEGGAPSSHSLRPGERVGRFVIVERIGQGAAGTVYVAQDAELERYVALKVLHSELPFPRRGLREARALARLNHANIVRVYEVGEHGERGFLAMEWIRGRNLRAWLAEQSRTRGEILRVFTQAGEGLAAAHRAGLVHCDFKPENVLVGSDGRACVVDFGVAAFDSEPARSAHPSSSSAIASVSTRSGFGTPAFMAPEQFAGEAVTPSSDQFAFCVALYSALFGAAPFAGTDIRTLRRNVLTGALAPRRFARADASLLRLLERGLSRNPTQRFHGMRALLAELARVGAPVREFEPVIGSRGRVLVCATMAVLGTGALFGLHFLPENSVLSQATVLVLVPAAALFVHALAARALRHQLLGSPQATRLIAVAWLGGVTVTLHRLLAFGFGQPVAEVIAVDLLVLGLQQAAAALLLGAWFGWMALVFWAGAGLTLLVPGYAVPVMLGSVVLAYGLGGVQAVLEGRRAPAAR